MKSSERCEHSKLTRSDGVAPEMKRRKTVSLNAIVANNAFNEGRGKSRGSAKAVKRERVSETGSARRRGPDPEEIVEDKEVPVIEIEDDDDVFPDEDPDPAATAQLYMSQLESYATQTNVMKLSEEEKHKLVAEVMRYMLFSQYRDGAPVTRTKLSEHLSKIAPELKRAKVSSYIVAEAQVKFNEIFGIEMKELSRKAQKKTGAARTNLQASEPTKEYVLKSLLPSKIRRQFIDREEDHTFRGFVMAVVALVSVSGGEIEEQVLWKHLAKLGVRHDDEAHPKLGNVRETLNKLCLQRYLMKERDVGSDGKDTFRYSLAERAMDELPTEKVDKYVLELMRGHNDEDGNATGENGNVA